MLRSLPRSPLAALARARAVGAGAEPVACRRRDGTANLVGAARRELGAQAGSVGRVARRTASRCRRSRIESIEGDLSFPRHMINVAADLRARRRCRFSLGPPSCFGSGCERGGKTTPVRYCKPTGVPLVNAVALPFKIVQTPSLVLVLYEENTVFRQIFLDGRKPVEDPVPRWMGYSTGRWEGDALVVDTVGFDDRHLARRDGSSAQRPIARHRALPPARRRATSRSRRRSTIPAPIRSRSPTP